MDRIVPARSACSGLACCQHLFRLVADAEERSWRSRILPQDPEGRAPDIAFNRTHGGARSGPWFSEYRAEGACHPRAAAAPDRQSATPALSSSAVSELHAAAPRTGAERGNSWRALMPSPQPAS